MSLSVFIYLLSSKRKGHKLRVLLIERKNNEETLISTKKMRELKELTEESEHTLRAIV